MSPLRLFSYRLIMTMGVCFSLFFLGLSIWIAFNYIKSNGHSLPDLLISSVFIVIAVNLGMVTWKLINLILKPEVTVGTIGDSAIGGPAKMRKIVLYYFLYPVIILLLLASLSVGDWKMVLMLLSLSS